MAETLNCRPLLGYTKKANYHKSTKRTADYHDLFSLYIRLKIVLINMNFLRQKKDCSL